MHLYRHVRREEEALAVAAVLLGTTTKKDTVNAYERAGEVQQMLTDGGMHRSAGPVDLLIAATAERERLTVLCDDRDFQAIARMTGQPVKLVTNI